MFSAIPVHSIVPHCPIPACQKLFVCANPHFEKGPGLRVYIRPCSRTEKLVPLSQTEDQTSKNGSDSDQRTCGRLFCCLCPGLSQHHAFIVGFAEPPLTAAMMLRRFYIAVGGMTQSTLFLFSSTLKITPPGAAAEYSAPGSSRYGMWVYRCSYDAGYLKPYLD